MKQRTIIHDLPEQSDYIKERWSKDHVNVILSNLKKKASENNYEYIRHCISCECEIKIDKKEVNEPYKNLVPGPPCLHCQNEFYIPTGICLTCANCGETSSCG